ncbi:transcriptional regulator [Virgibacillus profundi]|uniref:Transcriptional regulator n=1 Tax=Virgibacillus profundi TaxID=2024555 RepID=A0A2A2IJG2_9BACI|nr:LCP family protein [Virgibacillus profundi]PAV31290.1 transcriptional regulator [Virgibacillus profundi]PXY55475.1 LytR family transcriptional regulator [Virgibacillus profundi]
MSDKQKTTQTRMVRRKKKRKLRKRAYFLLVFFLIAFLSVISYATYLYIKADSVFSDSYKDDGREKSELREQAVDPAEDHVSVLIIGVDESEKRDNEGSARSDTLMLATMNVEDKSVNLVSIPRDSLVYIPEVGYETKINHAHAYGGPKASVETVENLLDIPVDYYVKVNFDAFIDVVDAVNGITVDVPYELSEQDSSDTKGAIHLLPGEQELNGEEALALARTRKFDNDIERGKRQQDIIKAVLKKSISLGSVLKYDNIIEAVGDNMTTNMTFDEMKSFISYGTKGNLEINTLTLEGHDYQPEGTYYWQLDEASLAETKQTLKEHLEYKGSVRSE